MFYEENWINGLLFWRGTPNGVWNAVPEERLCKKLLDTNARIAELQAAYDALTLLSKETIDARNERIEELEKALRDIADRSAFHTIEEMRQIANSGLMERS